MSQIASILTTLLALYALVTGAFLISGAWLVSVGHDTGGVVMLVFGVLVMLGHACVQALRILRGR